MVLAGAAMVDGDRGGRTRAARRRDGRRRGVRDGRGRRPGPTPAGPARGREATAIGGWPRPSSGLARPRRRVARPARARVRDLAYNVGVSSSQIFDDNARSIGRTPLVRLHRVYDGRATLLAKVEGRNPAYSVKDRIGAADDLGRREPRPARRQRRDRRGDQRQHRHRARVRRGGARDRVRAHDARDHERRAPQGPGRARRAAGPDPGDRRHAGGDRAGRGARRRGARALGADAPVRQPGQPGHPPRHHRARDLGRHRRRDRRPGLRGRHRRDDHRGRPLRRADPRPPAALGRGRAGDVAGHRPGPGRRRSPRPGRTRSRASAPASSRPTWSCPWSTRSRP